MPDPTPTAPAAPVAIPTELDAIVPHLPVMERVTQTAYDSLNAAGIEIPFNQLVIHRAG